jgi:hypothetical protein
MRTIRQQQGLTPIATLLILILVGFGVFLLFKMVRCTRILQRCLIGEFSSRTLLILGKE